MPGPEPLSKDLIELIELLKSHDVNFLVAGAHALAHHARPRFTEDLDLYIGRDPTNTAHLAEALNEFGVVLAQDALDRLANLDRGMIALGRRPNRVDLLNFLDGVSFEEAWTRRSPGKLVGIDVNFLGIEDFVATKRASARPKDRLDLEFLRDIVGSLPGDSES